MSATVYRETEHTARKAHRCESCPALIMPGDRYVDHFSITDGDSCSVRFCLPCAALIAAIWDERDPDDHLTYEDLGGVVDSLTSHPDPVVRAHAESWLGRIADASGGAT